MGTKNREAWLLGAMILLGILPTEGMAVEESQRSPSPAISQGAGQAVSAATRSPNKGGRSPQRPVTGRSDSAQRNDGVGKTPAEDKRGAVIPEFKPRRWSLSAMGSQRQDWFTGKTRFDWPPPYSIKKALKLPDWLSVTLEQRTRYETYDVPWIKGQTGGQYQIPLQTVLWLEANYEPFRIGVEFWDARQFGAGPDSTLNNTMVDVADFPQLYATWVTRDAFDTGLDLGVKGGRQTIDLGSRRLIARNAFRNTTNAFTGLLMRLREGRGDWEIQAFATQPVVRLPEEKDLLLQNDWAWDQEQKNTVFTGLFGSKLLPWQSLGELYLYYLKEDETSPKDRALYTPGLRWYKEPRKGEPDFEVESIAQVGTARTSPDAPVTEVRAFMEHVQAGYTFDLPWDPRLVLQYDYASGGTSGRGDNITSHSFDTLYGARVWEYGPTGIFGPFARNNLNAPGYRLYLVPHRDLAVQVAHRLWWMADPKAPWQPANLVDPSGKSGDFMGHTVEVGFRWDAHENFAFQAGWETLIKGGFARNAPGAPENHDNVNYFFFQSQVRF